MGLGLGSRLGLEEWLGLGLAEHLTPALLVILICRDLAYQTC